MQRFMLSSILVWLSLAVGACQSALHTEVETALANPQHSGIRWGILIADMDGTELFASRADDRFTPASNTKIVTTMATYHHFDALADDALNPGTRVYLEPAEDGDLPALVLRGGGDAMLQDHPDCQTQCLAALADDVAATGLNDVAALIGDDTLFPFERWGPGWSQEDLQYYFGTAVSALSVNDNLVWLEIRPGPEPGAPAIISWQTGDDYFTLENSVQTTAPEVDRALRVERHPGATTVRVYGTVPASADPIRFGLAVDDPAAIATMRFARLLRARGIEIRTVSTRHRPIGLIDEAPEPEDAVQSTMAKRNRLPDQPIAVLPGAPLPESLKRISKDSQNLHAEIALRRLGLLAGTGSRDFGLAVLSAMADEAQLADAEMTLHGGSGMSIYNRVSPRGMVKLLAFAAQQSWFETWLADQPIGGVDGSLQRRFVGTPLEGKIFAKTGTLNGANALSGVMTAASGRRLLFSIIANDRPPATRSAVPEMDAALVAIAEHY
ncbi:MAG: D-alanyl-D-alanine carboxypeptidase/D-alanyl-D-alanine-endopeptidase [Pseudomonadota bacterium]